MTEFLIALAATGAAFAVLDFIWLSLMVPRLYRPRLAEVLRTGMVFPPALAFYVIYAVGANLLVVMPALAAHAPVQGLLNGGLLGLIAYATYDLSNWATLKRWSATVAIVDIIWGTFLTAAACWIGVTVAVQFRG